jgi:putative acetyltransferase
VRRRTWLYLVSITVVLLAGCSHRTSSDFVATRSDRTVSGTSAYPLASAPQRVGSYPPDTKSGAGYFYDDVLEYRVWLHPERGADPANGGRDYFVAFAQFERADTFSRNTKGAEPPLALVRQLEWIDEPEPRHYVAKKGERLTEWQVRWLSGSRRTAVSISEFMKNPRPSRE